VNWAEVLEEKNALIAKLEEQLAGKEEPRTSHLATDVARWTKAERELAALETEYAYTRGLIKWTFDTLAPPIRMIDRRLPAVQAVRERLGKYLEKK